MTTTAYPALVAQLDAGAFPVVPPALVHARAGLAAAAEALRQVDAFAPLRPVALSAAGETLGRVSDAGPASLAESLARQLADGGALPTDLVEQSYAAVVADAKAQAADTVARLLGLEVARTFDQVAMECGTQLREGLRKQMRELMAQTKIAAQALDGFDVTQPATLVAAPDAVRTAYTDLGDLVQRYTTLRRAQRSLERTDDLPGFALFERLGLVDVQDALEMWPGWRQAEGDRQSFPWPQDPRQRLLLVAERKPWVAEREQMRAVCTSALARPVAA